MNPMDYAWALLKSTPEEQAAFWENLQARATPPQKAPVSLCEEAGCNEPGVGYDGMSEQRQFLCQRCLDASRESYEAVMRRAMGLPPKGGA